MFSLFISAQKAIVLQADLTNNVNKKDKYDADKKLSVAYCRARLGKIAEGKTDMEILKIRDCLYQIAQATYSAHKYSYNNTYEDVPR